MRTARRVGARRSRRFGLVSLVGAGPGDPELLTARAIQRLSLADLVLYDGLVPLEILRLAPAAEHVSVAKRAGLKELTQAGVNEMMIAASRAGRRVVRLKAGDSFVLGRGGEEVIALKEACVPFEIVPGVTSALAAPALAGIPVTHRGLSSGFVVVSGHAEAAYAPLLVSLAPDSATVIVLMGCAERAAIRQCLMGAGWRSATPAAVVANASQPNQRVWLGTLDALDSPEAFVDADEAGVIVIGSVVSLATAPSLVFPFVSEETTSWQPSTIQRL
jgi:uroporphyrin-III C-methyltransferase / precorrin-2 dehydrogenase / sirohydrochlorin ferrochelatase